MTSPPITTVAILLYPGVTALDAVGPYEVLHGVDAIRVVFVWKTPGPIITDSDALILVATHALDEVPTPDVILVPGSSGDTAIVMADDDVLAWLRAAHPTTRLTTSVCSGALILAAAGLLDGARATTHWYAMDALRAMGARTQPDERVVKNGRVWTAAGVSAGVDLGLHLVAEIAGEHAARVAQLWVEYDPMPPFDSGHVTKATKEVRQSARRVARELAVNTRSARVLPKLITAQCRRAIARVRGKRR